MSSVYDYMPGGAKYGATTADNFIINQQRVLSIGVDDSHNWGSGGQAFKVEMLPDSKFSMFPLASIIPSVTEIDVRAGVYMENYNEPGAGIFCIFFRYIDQDNYFVLRLQTYDSTEKKVQLGYVVTGIFTELQSTEFNMEPYCSFKIRTYGTEILVDYINGAASSGNLFDRDLIWTNLFSVTEQQQSQYRGSVGVYLYRNGHNTQDTFYIDDFMAYRTVGGAQQQ